MVCNDMQQSTVLLAIVSWGPAVARRSESALTRLRVSSSDESPLEMTRNAGGDSGFQVRCAGQVVVEADGYSARAEKVTFVSGKSLLILESRTADAQLTSHGDGHGHEASLSGRRISVKLTTGQVDVARDRSKKNGASCPPGQRPADRDGSARLSSPSSTEPTTRAPLAPISNNN